MLTKLLGGRHLAPCVAFLSALISGLASGLITGCQSENQGNDSQFVAFDSSGAIQNLEQFYGNLRTMRSAKLCIGFVGFEKDSDKVDNYSVIALRSLRRWFAALRGVTAWNGAPTPDLVHRVQFDACRYKDMLQGDRFGVTFYATQSHFVADVCGPSSPAVANVGGSLVGGLSGSFRAAVCQQNVGYSFGYAGQGAVFMSPLWSDGSSRHSRMEEAVMHELGHVMGLDDAYLIPNAAPSLMKYAGGVSPYPDDLAGLEYIVGLVAGKSGQCGRAQGSNSTYEGAKSTRCPAQSGLAETRLENHAVMENSQSGDKNSSNGEIDSPADDPGKRHLIVFTQDSFFKASPDKEARYMDDSEICGVQAGQRFLVTLDASRDRNKNSFYRFDRPIEGCPESVGTSGYFYTSHAEMSPLR